MSRAVWAVWWLVEILNELELKMDALAAVLRMLGRTVLLNRRRGAVPESRLFQLVSVGLRWSSCGVVRRREAS